MLLIIQQKSFDFLPLIIQLMLIWLKNSTQSMQKYMQIWRIPMSPLEASTNSLGHMTTFFRTSMSETTPPQNYATLFFNHKIWVNSEII